MGRVRRFPGREGWYVDWSDARGRRHRSRVHGDKRLAEKLLKERDAQTLVERERLRMGLTGPGDGDDTLESLVRDWRQHLTDSRRRPATWKSYWLGLREILTWLDARGRRVAEISDLDVRDIRIYADEKLAGVGAFLTSKGVPRPATARTVNMRVGALVSLCRWAIREGRSVVNPLARWRPMSGPKKREPRALTTMEMCQLLKCSPPELADLWRFILGTGVRAGELSGIEWPDVDLAARTVCIRVGEGRKTKRERHIPLRDDLVDVLRRRQAAAAVASARAAARVKTMEARAQRDAGTASAARSDRELRAARAAVEASRRYVFTNAGGGNWRQELSRRLKPCLRAAGLDVTLNVHSLRHTFGSQLVAAGVDVRTVADLMGHRDPGMTMRVYAHSFADRRRGAVDAIPLIPDENATEVGAKVCAGGA